MYDEHFGLTGRPFQLTPDPAFWYETATHRRAMAYLGYGLAQGEGFIVITGDIGAGKTTLVGHLLDTLDREALNPVQIVSTAVEGSDLLRMVAARLGIDTAGLEKAQLLVAIERGLHAVARTGRRTLLIVDEAQALATSALEELRMLSNFQAGGHALLQIVLLGQPEFRAALHGREGLEQLRQRVIAIHHLDPMAASEVAAYVHHRLAVVGWSDRPAFADSAFAALHRHSGGVPRRLNQLANRVMLHAAVERTTCITAATVETVAADLSADLPMAGVTVEAQRSVPEAEPELALEPTLAEASAAEPAGSPIVEEPSVADDGVPEERHAPFSFAEEPEQERAPVPSDAVSPAGFSAAVEDEATLPEPVDAEPLSAADDPLPELEEGSSSIGASEAHAEPSSAGTEASLPVSDVEAGEDRSVPASTTAVAAPFVPSAEEEPAPASFDEEKTETATGPTVAAEPEPAPAADPRPFRHSWLDIADALPDAAPIVAEEAETEAVAATGTPRPAEPALAERLAEVEARIAEQDAALRRVLTLLVDWVETEQPPRSVAAVADLDAEMASRRAYVPIRGAAAA